MMTIMTVKYDLIRDGYFDPEVSSILSKVS